ncbi:hypothetical protein LIPSTDRAFT_177028 [Lipomyces starkeyi NRRL Y-11557]|uniref:Uncharacterized protein n=1 Tax=Lipomyces starkeyi NRRL Y-11557 TaxID=675824 RepID=A0A1E3PZH4_LIPST|nr:hypothetical protein LIPSTDRAFT_177028 [Lipomyces starkeyi NRRL Y-11557]
MIPNNPHYSPSSTLTAEFNRTRNTIDGNIRHTNLSPVRFAPASLSVNAVFSSHSTTLLIVPLRSISLSFTFHRQHVPVSAANPKKRVDAKCGPLITEMLGLADRSLRNIILSKLAPKMPLLFCPGYAEVSNPTLCKIYSKFGRVYLLIPGLGNTRQIQITRHHNRPFSP